MCLSGGGSRGAVSFMGVRLMQSNRALHSQGPHSWFNACCHHLEILDNF